MGKAHHMMSKAAGNGSERPISAAQADASLIPSAERSVALKVLKYTSLLSSAPGAVGFLLCCTRVVTKKKKIRYFGESIIRTGLLV